MQFVCRRISPRAIRSYASCMELLGTAVGRRRIGRPAEAHVIAHKARHALGDAPSGGFSNVISKMQPNCRPYAGPSSIR